MRQPTIALRSAMASLALGGLFVCASVAIAGETKGPDGEAATPSSALTLTDSEVAKIKDGKYTDVRSSGTPPRTS